MVCYATHGPGHAVKSVGPVPPAQSCTVCLQPSSYVCCAMGLAVYLLQYHRPGCATVLLHCFSRAAGRGSILQPRGSQGSCSRQQPRSSRRSRTGKLSGCQGAAGSWQRRRSSNQQLATGANVLPSLSHTAEVRTCDTVKQWSGIYQCSSLVIIIPCCCHCRATLQCSWHTS